MDDITMANAPDREESEGEEINTPAHLFIIHRLILRSVKTNLRKRIGKEIATLNRYVSDVKT